MSARNLEAESAEAGSRLDPWIALKHVGRYVKRHPWMFAAVVFSVFASAAASRTLPWIIGKIVDDAILPKDARLFLRLSILYLAVEGLKTIFYFLQSYYFSVFGNRMLYYVREDVYRHVLDLPLDYFNRTPAGRTVTRMTNDVGALGELFSDGVVAVFTRSVTLMATIVAMAMLSLKLTLLTLLLTPIFVWWAHFLTVRVRRLMHEMKAKLSILNAFLAENISGLRITQLYGQTARQSARFVALSDDYRKWNLDVIRNYAWLQPALNLLNATLITAALVAGGWMTLENALPLGALVTFLMYAQDFIFPIREILEKIQQFQNSLTSAERVFALLEEPAETGTEGELAGDLQGRIELRRLTFRYRPELPDAIIDASLTVEPGESVALVGRTGSGKTTLISLLQRFYDAPAGTIFLDGKPLESYPRRALRRRLGVIQQDPVLFRGSLLFNLTMGHPEVTEERARRACERVGLKRPLDLFVEERGANLSLGERQLVAFARILAFDPHLLIMDEATANIDSETERLLQKATLEVTKGRTSILIAHRLSTIEHCDRVVVLEKGRVAETGTPAELRRAGGIFAQLASARSADTRTSAPGAGTADP